MDVQERFGIETNVVRIVRCLDECAAALDSECPNLQEGQCPFLAADLVTLFMDADLLRNRAGLTQNNNL
eukprot:10737753-Prorocentrum_lima.AAC.1